MSCLHLWLLAAALYTLEGGYLEIPKCSSARRIGSCFGGLFWRSMGLVCGLTGNGDGQS